MRQAAQFHVERIIKIDEAAEKMRVADGIERPFFGFGGGEIGTLAIDEATVGLADAGNFGVTCHCPERAIAGRGAPVHRIVGPKPRINGMNAFVRRSFGVNENVVVAGPIETGKRHDGIGKGGGHG